MTFSRITIDPAICHGKPVVQGTRVLVSNVLASLAAGESFPEIRGHYPNLTDDDIRSALEFGSQLAQFDTLPSAALG